MTKRYAPEDPPDDLGMFAAMDRLFDAIEFDPPGPHSGEILNPPGLTMEKIQRLYEPFVRGELDTPPAPPAPYLDASGAPPVLGSTYSEKLDGARLGAQFLRVRSIMDEGAWRTLREIAAETGDPEASISARLRDLRRAGYVVERRRRTSSLWEYRAERSKKVP
jgi:hypothetical protein